MHFFIKKLTTSSFSLSLSLLLPDRAGWRLSLGKLVVGTWMVAFSLLSCQSLPVRKKTFWHQLVFFLEKAADLVCYLVEIFELKMNGSSVQNFAVLSTLDLDINFAFWFDVSAFIACSMIWDVGSNSTAVERRMWSRWGDWREVVSQRQRAGMRKAPPGAL